MALAGCAGGEGEGKVVENVRGFRDAHDSTTGSVTGYVLDDSLLPIEGAKVSLLTADGLSVYQEVETDESGAYGFVYVPAGVYQVEAKAAGFDVGILTVTVVAGQVLSDTSFYLPAAFADVAYYITDSITRMIGGGTVKWWTQCGQSVLYKYDIPAPLIEKYCIGGNTCPGTVNPPAATGLPPQRVGPCENVSGGCQGSYSTERLPENSTNEYGGNNYIGGYRDLLRNNTNWQTQLGEVDWQASSTVSGRGVLFEILGPNVTNGDGTRTNRCGGINQSDPRDFLVVSDVPAVRIEINDDLLAARGVTLEDRCCDWRFRLFPGWCDLGNCDRWGPDANVLGAAAPTTVNVFYSIFFKERAPPGWTAVGDEG